MSEENHILSLAKTNFRNKPIKFGIKQDDRRRHMYLIGKTGTGKSTVMENMIIQDIRAGRGVALVDPHGDFAEKILDYIPNDRVNDVVYFNPADINYPIAFNVMESVAAEHKHLIASGLVGVFKKLWADSWGPRLEYVLRNAILALLDYPGSTLLGVMRILQDKNFRKKVISKIQDPVVRTFWVEEYSKYPDRFQAEAIAPIQNKVGQFLSTSLIRNVVGQVKSTINLRDIMDNRKILLMNLSKGRIGEDASGLFGNMMITKIQLAAMSRIDVVEPNRQDFYLYVDEFQNFATESFANILSEARKYRLNLIIAHQYIEQLEDEVRSAVFGNVGTIMCFRVGAGDSEFLVKEFAPYFDEEDVVNLTKYNVYMKLMIDGVASNPFSATTLPPLANDDKTNNAEKVIQVSRERYSKPKDVVEDKIARWSGMAGEEEEDKASENTPSRYAKKDAEDKKETVSEKRRPAASKDSQGSKGRETYVVECYECGTPTEVNFQPDGIRPVYCKNCFRDIRNKVIRGGTDNKNEEEEKAVTSSISLLDVLNQEPVSFNDEKQKKTDKRHKEDGRGDKNDNEELSLKDIEKESRNNSSNHNIARPGEVIKF